jgi:hypothetical protein
MNVMRSPPPLIREQIAACYAALDPASQIVMLARLANRLSLMARETYEVGEGVSDAGRLRAFNEAQNRILAQLERLVMADPARYPDDVFANIMLDQLQSVHVDPERTLAAIGMSLGQAEIR